MLSGALHSSKVTQHTQLMYLVRYSGMYFRFNSYQCKALEFAYRFVIKKKKKNCEGLLIFFIIIIIFKETGKKEAKVNWGERYWMFGEFGKLVLLLVFFFFFGCILLGLFMWGIMVNGYLFNYTLNWIYNDGHEYLMLSVRSFWVMFVVVVLVRNNG